MESNTYPMMRQLEDQHWWFVARREILGCLLSRIALPADANILEVGCGTGGNIKLLLQFGTLTCVEQSLAAAELARQRGGAPVLGGSLPDGLPAFASPFDLVTVFDVIEHVDEDGASLLTLSTLLKPGGRIVVTVPAFNFLWSLHDDENHHKRRYCKRDLLELAGQSGLSVDFIGYFNTWLFPPVAAVRLFRKLIPYQESWKDRQQPPALLNESLRFIFASERHLAGRLSVPFGISLMAVLSLAQSGSEH